MTAFFVLVIFTLPNADDTIVRRVRDTLKKTGLEDVILACDDRNYTLPNNYILAGEFMAHNAGQCRKILYKKFERAFQDIALPTGGQLAYVAGLSGRYAYFPRSCPKRQSLRC